MKGKNIVLFLERPHWESTVYVNENAGTALQFRISSTYQIFL